MITNELISEIKSKINDNQKQAITGGILQGVLVDMVNGLTTTGLTFLGILGPDDPAPSNEPTGGYYLSFQASTKKTPYFNGVHLHRYCLLIWTQDEQGRWKFNKVKYEDHRGPKRVVVGRALPVHYNKESGTCTIHLSGDGTRDIYAICGRQVLRGEIDGLLAYRLSSVFGTGRNSIRTRQYSFVQFHKTDDGKELTLYELPQFIQDHIIAPILDLRASSEAYEIKENGIILWCPKIQSKVTNAKRVIRDNTFREHPDNTPAKKWVIKIIPKNSPVIFSHLKNTSSRIYRTKRYKIFQGRKRAAGLSDNYLQIERRRE